MTCASCANRIERKLNRLDGVTATVNLATEQALVVYPDDIGAEDLIAVVEAAGYGAALPAPSLPLEPTSVPRAPLQHLLVSTALAIPILLMSMVPALQFRDWQWLSLTLAAPVLVWGGWPFHHAAAVNLRHRTTTMDTLISLARSRPSPGRSTPSSSATQACPA